MNWINSLVLKVLLHGERTRVSSKQCLLCGLRRTIVVLILGTLVQCASCATVETRTRRAQRGLDMCEPIDIPMCVSMPYNMTRMPNHLHHSTQENARLAIEPYGELLKQNCSEHLLFFLCAMFAPICTPQFQLEAIPPCRSVCEASRRGCEPLMNVYNYSWPEDLDCNRLPEYDKGVCVSPEAIVSSMPEDNNNPKVPDKRKERKKDCKCEDKIKPSKKAYKRGNYDYAIGALVKHTTHTDKNYTITRVLVKSILKRGKIHLQKDREIDLWTNSSCVCPPLKMNRQYLIIGREQVLLNRLLFEETSLVTRWNTKWQNKVKKWTVHRKKNNKKRRCKKRKCKKNKSKTKLTCSVEQSSENTKQIKCIRKKGNKSKNKLDTAENRTQKGNRRHRHKKRRNDSNETKI